MKAIVKAVKQERKSLLRQLKLVESTLAKFGTATVRRKRRVSKRKTAKAAAATAATKRGGGKKKAVAAKKDDEATIEARRERARMARQERPVAD